MAALDSTYAKRDNLAFEAHWAEIHDAHANIETIFGEVQTLASNLADDGAMWHPAACSAVGARINRLCRVIDTQMDALQLAVENFATEFNPSVLA